MIGLTELETTIGSLATNIGVVSTTVGVSVRPPKWIKVSRSSHGTYRLVKMLMKCIKAFMIYLKSFGGQTSRTFDDV